MTENDKPKPIEFSPGSIDRSWLDDVCELRVSLPESWRAHEAPGNITTRPATGGDLMAVLEQNAYLRSWVETQLELSARRRERARAEWEKNRGVRVQDGSEPDAGLENTSG